MNKAIFLDRDGTINVEKNYLYKIEDFEFLPGVIQALSLFREAGFLLIIITNQSGIARGFYKESDFLNLNNWMIKEFEDNKIKIEDVFYCPHHPDAKELHYKKNCDCRKPQIGLFKKAIDKYNIDIEHSFSIGDKLRDCAISFETECKSYLIGNNESVDIVNDVKNGKYRNISYCSNILDCAREITGLK